MNFQTHDIDGHHSDRQESLFTHLQAFNHPLRISHPLPGTSPRSLIAFRSKRPCHPSIRLTAAVASGICKTTNPNQRMTLSRVTVASQKSRDSPRRHSAWRRSESWRHTCRWKSGSESRRCSGLRGHTGESRGHHSGWE